MKTLLFCLALLAGGFAQSGTWYVATNGSDANPGTLGQPFRTLPAAIDAASPGDAILLRGGTYASNEIRITKSNLRIASYPGEWAVLQAPLNNEDIASCIWYSEPSVNGGSLERLEIIGGYYYGVSFETNWDWGLPTREGASNITLRECRIHDTGRDCIKIKPACNNITVLACEIYRSGVGPSNHPNNGGPNAEGIDNVNGDGMVVRQCHIHDISTTGVYVKGGAQNCIVEQNLIHGTSEAGILLGFYTDAEFFDQDGTNPAYFECQYSVARNNIIYNTGGAGLGFFAARNCSAYHNTVVTASSNFHAPLYLSPGEIWINDQTTLTPANLNIEVYNNLFVDQSGMGEEDYTVQVRENALSGNNLINHNLYYKPSGSARFYDGINWPAFTLADWRTQTGWDANSLEASPRLNNNLHLEADSPAIDAGQNSPATNDYDASSRSGPADIGADEWGNGNDLPVPPPIGTLGTGADVAVFTESASNATYSITISPNPSTGPIQVSCPTGYNPKNFIVIDASGRAVHVTDRPDLDLGHLPTGLYFLLLSGYGQVPAIQPFVLAKP